MRIALWLGEAYQALRTDILAFVLGRVLAAEARGVTVALYQGYRESLDWEPGLEDARRLHRCCEVCACSRQREMPIRDSVLQERRD